MKINILLHARQRMRRYNITEAQVQQALRKPDSDLSGHSGRRIAQRMLNGYVLRVIYEEQRAETVVVTVYKARRERYKI